MAGRPTVDCRSRLGARGAPLAALDRGARGPDARPAPHRGAPTCATAASWVDRPTRRHKTKPRPLVLLCDVSGSMERYSRMLLHFVHTLSGRDPTARVESFVFATRLTRITRQLAARAAGRRSCPTLPRTIGDFGGRHPASARRCGPSTSTGPGAWRGQSPVVLLISDGWDRGEPHVLRRRDGPLAALVPTADLAEPPARLPRLPGP